ncbi:unnamed protein product [Colias eurytheme]|nr:unnamed protein product [Colias eurytheme]
MVYVARGFTRWPRGKATPRLASVGAGRLRPLRAGVLRAALGCGRLGSESVFGVHDTPGDCLCGLNSELPVKCHVD